MKTEQPRRWLMRIVLGLAGLAALAASVLAILATTTKLPGEEKTPSGVRRDTALYIKMHDGVQIAADVLASSGLSGGPAAADVASHYALRARWPVWLGIPAGGGFQAD